MNLMRSARETGMLHGSGALLVWPTLRLANTVTAVFLPQRILIWNRAQKEVILNLKITLKAHSNDIMEGWCWKTDKFDPFSASFYCFIPLMNCWMRFAHHGHSRTGWSSVAWLNLTSHKEGLWNECWSICFPLQPKQLSFPGNACTGRDERLWRHRPRRLTFACACDFGEHK